LKPSDSLEFLAVIFSDLTKDEIKKVLPGFTPEEIEDIQNITDAISLITDESAETAYEILKTIKGKRIQNMIRLLYAMKFKTLAKLVRNQKDTVFSVNQLCINSDIIKATFKINDEIEIKKLLDKALQKVIVSPEFNEKYKILSYLNNERV
jgi:hypothetical protein